MANIRMSLIYYLVMCVLLEDSIVLPSCVVNQDTPIYCTYHPSGFQIPSFVLCEIHSFVDATTLRNVLTSCTVGEPYSTIIVDYQDSLDPELQLDLQLVDNITGLCIVLNSNQQLYINPLKKAYKYNTFTNKACEMGNT